MRVVWANLTTRLMNGGIGNNNGWPIANEARSRNCFLNSNSGSSSGAANPLSNDLLALETYPSRFATETKDRI